MIPVLLIDDQPLNPLILIAKNRYNIEITQFFNLEEAQEELKRHDYYKAVILDCYCSKDSSNELHSSFLTRAISCINKSGKMPWYIYTGGTEKGDFPSIIDNLPGEFDNPWKQWDPFNEKGYYSKSGSTAEIELLLSRIVDLDKERNDVISHYKKYVDIIKRCCQGPTNENSKWNCLSEEIIDNLIKILIPIYHNKLDDCTDKEMGGYFRSCLEYFLDSCVINGTMPHASYEVPEKAAAAKINCFIGIKYSSQNKDSITSADGGTISLKKEVQENLKRKKKIPSFVSSTLNNMREIGNSVANHAQTNYKINNSQQRIQNCGGYWKNQFISCCFNFLDLLLWYDLEFDKLKKNANECRKEKEVQEAYGKVTGYISPKSENSENDVVPPVSNIAQSESPSKPKENSQEYPRFVIQQGEQIEVDETLDTTSKENFSSNLNVESREGTQKDMSQENNVSDTIGKGDIPIVDNIKKTYIVKSFKNYRGNIFRCCEYESKKALFETKASVEEGDEIILMRVPIDNNKPSLNRTYPLYIPEFSYEKVNK